MIPLLTETGDFTISNSTSNYVEFLFFGDQEFLERTKILCENYGLLWRGAFHTFKEHHLYILTPLDRLKSGLLEYFRGEVIFEKQQEINYKTTELKDELGDTVEIMVDWCEEAVMLLAQQKLDRFLSEKVKYENLLDRPDSTPLTEYSLGTL
jgi:DNA-binding HxlR family transcriptional regulator